MLVKFSRRNCLCNLHEILHTRIKGTGNSYLSFTKTILFRGGIKITLLVIEVSNRNSIRTNIP